MTRLGKLNQILNWKKKVKKR